MIDPAGLALENFTAIGRWRDLEAGAPIDPSSELPGGKPVAGPVQLTAALLERDDQEIHQHHAGQHDQRGTDQIRDVLAYEHRAAPNRAREQIRDRLVLDLVGDERRAVEDAEHRHDEPQEQQPDHHAEDGRVVHALAVDPERRHAHRIHDAYDRGNEDRTADDNRQEYCAARPEHLAQRQLEDTPRAAHE